MGYGDFDNFEINRKIIQEKKPVKQGVYIPSLHQNNSDSVEISNHKNNLKDKDNKLVSFAKNIVMHVINKKEETESKIPDAIRDCSEDERQFYLKCLEWEAADEEKILELVEIISQMEPEAKQAVLDENFAYISRAESLLENDERVSSAFNEGRITKGDVFGIAQLRDKDAECIMNLLPNKKFTMFLEMNRNLEMFGLESVADIEEYLEENPASFGKETQNFMNAGFDPFTSLTLAFNGDFAQKVEGFLKDGYSENTALTLANIQNSENFDIPEVARLIENISPDEDYDIETAQYLSDYLNSEENKNLDLVDFNEYIENIDKDELSITAPLVNNYNGKQMLQFSDFHYKSGTEEFTEENLTLPGDFTSYLMQHYLNADELSELLTVYPMTSRDVGTMPEGWLENISDKEKATKDIYSAVSDFQKDKNQDKLAENLSKITGKEVQIERLGSGHYGTGYKISMPGSDDMCLKIFKTGKISHETNNIHGQHIEVQTGLFVNEHSDDFVKMYFGRVSPGNMDDGFIVTQFLSQDSTPVETGAGDDGRYIITSSDTSGEHNIINGKIIDYGSVIVDMKKAE